MNNYDWLTPRRRRQNLFIVEGKHEKNKLIHLLLQIYPEIDINLDNVIIYGTNIYMLYNEIASIYQNDWYMSDVDLPYIVSRKKGYTEALYKNDFNNIVLIFDYERHDLNFSEEKILKMQEYFLDATDVGKLFINYPMMESYQHLFNLPDNNYTNLSIPVTMQPGFQYKNLIKNTMIAEMVKLPQKLKNILLGRFHLIDETLCERYIDEILSICCEDNIIEQITKILADALNEQELNTAKYQLKDYVMKCKYPSMKKTYNEYMRTVFNQIIQHNICKANKIQRDIYLMNNAVLKEYFESLDLLDVLLKQNDSSQDSMDGIIWVLNTSVFFIPDYNYELIEK